MPLQITVKDLQKKIPLRRSRLEQKTKKILKAQAVSQGELSLVFVTDSRIRSLNKRYLKHYYATDVLTFNFKEAPDDVKRKKMRKPIQKTISAEIIISTDRVVAYAKKYKTPLDQELWRYVVHGILHLLGFDDGAPQEIQRMRQKEEEILKKMNSFSF